MGLLILYVSMALSVSFLCSIMEATILSMTNSYIKKLIKDGRGSGKILWDFKKNVDRPLSGILTLNTIANTLGATGAGAQAEKVFESRWVGLFAILLTLAILIFSEIIPKTIGAVYWRKTAPATAYILKVILFILHPFILLMQAVVKIIPNTKKTNLKIFREEISVLAEIGEDIGALSESEEKVIRNLLALNKVKIKEILTPRTVMFTLPIDISVAQVLEEKRSLPYSRIPVYKDDIDDISGLVLRDEILTAVANDEHEKQLADMVREIHAVPKSLTIAQAIDRFIERGEHIFVVIDEYGGTEGIVTMEDALEALLGTEIVDEKDRVTDMRELAVRLWRYKTRSHERENSKSKDLSNP